MQSREASIAVVGGGLSGLNFAASSASVLGNSYRVSLIETRNKSGGRTIRSERADSAMQELGAFFVYDKDVHNQLIGVGAQVRLLNDDDFYIVQNGALQACGKSRGPFGLIDTIASQLSQLSHNISIGQALQNNETFQSLSPPLQRIITTILEADLAASLDKVGISSLRFDGQTVVSGESVEDPMFGVCIQEGFSSLARNLEERFQGEKGYSVHLEGLELASGRVVLHLRDKKSTETFCRETDKVYLGLPLQGLKDLKLFKDGRESGSFIDELTENQQRALSMLDTGDAIKITIPIRGKVIPGKDIFNLALDPLPGSDIRCGEVWGLPMPSYADTSATSEQGYDQVIMMYLGGTQATDLRTKLVGAKRSQKNVPDFLNSLVTNYLKQHLGIAEERVGKVYISMWLSQFGGRGAYSYIKADNQPAEFNPRAQFSEPHCGAIHIGGSAFSGEEPTLTGGAQASAELHLQRIIASDGIPYAA